MPRKKNGTREPAKRMMILLLSLMLAVSWMPVTGVYAAGEDTDIQEILNNMSVHQKITINGLKSNRKYVIRARAYRTAYGEKICGAWSETKKIRTKK